MTSYLSVDAKNSSNGHEAVNVGRSIQGIEADHVFPLNNNKKGDLTLKVNTVLQKRKYTEGIKTEI